jgi:hypothetical protein
MNVDKNILDNVEQKGKSKSKLKSRVPSDLMIVIGILLLILGLVFLYLFIDAAYEVSNSHLFQSIPWTSVLFLRMMLTLSLLFLFGLNLIIGGVGLIRHSKIGWILSFAVAVFSVVLPALFAIIRIFIPYLKLTIPSWFAIIYLVFFGLILWFLLSPAIRNFYSPTTKSYGIAGVIVIVFSLLFVGVPLLT